MKGEGSATGGRRLISTWFTWVQDVVYVALAVFLGVAAVAVLVHGGIDFTRAIAAGIENRAIVSLLDRILLALMIVELLYTVQISFREHTLVPEPFILVALIAAVRRILVITAEFGAQSHPGGDLLKQVLWELALLSVLIVILVVSLVLLRARVAPTGPDTHAASPPTVPAQSPPAAPSSKLASIE